MAFDPFTTLSPSSRAPSSRAPSSRARSSRAPTTPALTRMRVGAGAAVVLLLAALGVTVAVTAIGQIGHSVEVAANPDSVAVPDAESTDQVPGATGSTQPTTGENPAIFVHVLGAVARPGLFEVSEGARVVDVVAAAGGLLPTADQTGVNLARLVSDGEQLYIPLLGEVVPGTAAGTQGGSGAGGSGEAGSGASGSAPGTTAIVNLNTATVADLETLPRIGPMMAQRILDYRDAEGRFASVEDLQNVTGIGEKTFAALKDLVSV